MSSIDQAQFDALVARIDTLEKKIELLTANQTDEPKKTKKAKKEKKSDDSPKKKRYNGYFLFQTAHREEAKSLLEDECEEGDKVKNTDILKKLGAMWSDIGDEGKAPWNAKAAEMKEASEKVED